MSRMEEKMEIKFSMLDQLLRARAAAVAVVLLFITIVLHGILTP